VPPGIRGPDYARLPDEHRIQIGGPATTRRRRVFTLTESVFDHLCRLLEGTGIDAETRHHLYTFPAPVIGATNGVAGLSHPRVVALKLVRRNLRVRS